MTTSLSVGVLIFVGVILTFLGLFAAGRIELIALGVGTLVAAGLFQTLQQRPAGR
ncbi:MAG TPA: hypothetical protein VFO73_12145 [Candidatus Limnocylindrales bacterium]|nr:hypothetical protein [Candidatus Limnocylindrales bacterium]